MIWIYFFNSLAVSTRDCFFEVFITADFVGGASACFLVVFNVSSFFGDSIATALESSNGLGVRFPLSVLVALYRSTSRLALILLRIASFAEKAASCSTCSPITQSSSKDSSALDAGRISSVYSLKKLSCDQPESFSIF